MHDSRTTCAARQIHRSKRLICNVLLGFASNFRRSGRRNSWRAAFCAHGGPKVMNFPGYAFRRATLALLAASAFACGDGAHESPASTVVDPSGPGEGASLDPPTNVRACEVTAAGLGFNLTG